MLRIYSVSELPNVPAVYALYGGKENNRYVAYVGIADKLRKRIEQHIIRRDSSVTTSTSTACLNPEYISELRWWQHTDFVKRDLLEAAELIAFNLFDPILRSRGKITKRSLKLRNDEKFQREITHLLSSEAKGQLIFLTLQDALSKIEMLEKRIAAIERQLLK